MIIIWPKSHIQSYIDHSFCCGGLDRVIFLEETNASNSVEKPETSPIKLDFKQDYFCKMRCKMTNFCFAFFVEGGVIGGHGPSLPRFCWLVHCCLWSLLDELQYCVFDNDHDVKKWNWKRKSWFNGNQHD